MGTGLDREMDRGEGGARGFPGPVPVTSNDSLALSPTAAVTLRDSLTLSLIVTPCPCHLGPLSPAGTPCHSHPLCQPCPRSCCHPQ